MTVFASSSELEQLRCELADFAAQRDWDQFHSPKNLAMALIAESAELVEHFQWLTQAQSHELDAAKRQAAAHEIADILIYLIRIADKLGIDPIAAAREKMVMNQQRYPVDKVRGSAKRASEYT